MFKNKMFVFLLLLVTLSSVAVASVIEKDSAANLTNQKVQTKEIMLSVPGMTCPVCPITVKKALIDVKGVIKVNVNFKGKTVAVIINPKLTTLKKLIKATTDVGYPSKSIKIHKPGEHE